MIRAASLPLDIDLRSFSQFLQQQGVGHRITEESGEQAVWVQQENEAEFVRHALGEWDFAAVSPRPEGSQRPLVSVDRLLAGLLRNIWLSPLTMALVILCILVAAYTRLGVDTFRVDFLFYPRLSSIGLWSLLGDITSPVTLLRTLTPILLHFGELHIIFNMLWLWFFGRQLEAQQPRWLFAILVLVTAFAGNTAQYLYSGANNFGGMSGVVFGLVGYAWVIHVSMPQSRLMITNQMFVAFVVILVVMELIAGAWIATAAHVGGLLSGLLVAAAAVFVYRVLLQRPYIG